MLATYADNNNVCPTRPICEYALSVADMQLMEFSLLLMHLTIFNLAY
ncbi:hypothetical protein [Vibrio gallaecicus]|nr:hypothetical protein [Vibrio gallaecicus]MDN3613959.1 hypothetical protein [Vibrio gallaecicus]